MKSYHKAIRKIIRDLLICAIGAIAIVAMIIGAALQEQDKLGEMAVQEVQR